MLEEIKLLLGIQDASKDDLINLYIKHATQDAINYCGSEDVSPISYIIERMAVYLYNRNGSEGLESETYTGATYHYESNYPESITSLLDKYRDSIGNSSYLKTYQVEIVINRELKKYTVKTYGGKDEYGQELAELTQTKEVEIAIGVYSQTQTSDVRYTDTKFYGLTKDKSITDKDYIVIDGEEHKVIYVNPTTRWVQLYVG